MSTLENKIDFVALISVENANSNGDPLNGNRPRTDYNGYGEISDVCIKRKIRNRMQDLGHKVFVQSDERSDDGCKSLKERASDYSNEKDADKYYENVCKKWIDVRTFGQVFAFKGFNIKSLGVRGPVSVHLAQSISPIEINSMQITKSVSGDKKEGKEKNSDTMGTKHSVRFGLYKIKGTINVQLAEKTGFSKEDADVIKECLRTLFINDASAARPDGSMEVVKLFWFNHNCKDGQYSSAKVHRMVEVKLKRDIIIPTSVDDYDIKLNKPSDLICEEIDGE